LSSLTAGGPAPIIATYLLVNQTRLAPGLPAYMLIAGYIIAMSIISFAAVLPLKEYAGLAPAENEARTQDIRAVEPLTTTSATSTTTAGN
jgi:hypothetical protein